MIMYEILSNGFNRMWGFIGCAVLASVTPTQQFVVSVIIACFFNTWCGMRADGVINIRCRNFSWRKFRYCLAELFAFLLVIELIGCICHVMNDAQAGYYACKTAAYCIIYTYIDNGLKNLCKSYPKSRGLWFVYLFVHLDFARIVKIDDLINRYEEHTKRKDEILNEK